jgi:hypothetical protein
VRDEKSLEGEFVETAGDLRQYQEVSVIEDLAKT